jgi:hypothetical protein
MEKGGIRYFRNTKNKNKNKKNKEGQKIEQTTSTWNYQVSISDKTTLSDPPHP